MKRVAALRSSVSLYHSPMTPSGFVNGAVKCTSYWPGVSPSARKRPAASVVALETWPPRTRKTSTWDPTAGLPSDSVAVPLMVA